MKMIEDYDKVKSVFRSCRTPEQLEMAKKVLCVFFDMYADQFDEVTREKTRQDIQEIIFECMTRITK